MKKSIAKKSLVAALAVTCSAVPTSALMAQGVNLNSWRNLRVTPTVRTPAPVVKRSYNTRIVVPNNPITNYRRNITVAPSAYANASTSSRPVTMGPSRGPIGSQIRVQVNRNLGANPAILSFKAVVTNGVPARVHTRLSGGGGGYSTPAPIQLCIQGGGTWQAELVLANGRNLGVIGSFTPTNCPR